MSGSVAGAASSLANEVDALAKLEAQHPGVTAEVKTLINEGVNDAIGKLPAKTQAEVKTTVPIIGGVITAAVAAFLTLTGHPVEAGELSGLFAGITALGFGLHQKVSS